MAPRSVSLLPLLSVPLVQAGDDLAALLVQAATADEVGLEEGDVLVVTGKVVSKAEGRWFDLADIEASPRATALASLTDKDPALVEVVLGESSDVIRARPGVLLVRHVRGWVSAMAGIDRSNVDGDETHGLLLPADPDASAEALRAALRTATGADVGVVISDSHGRPFRHGNTGVAIGAAGVPALRRLEGEPDLFGRPLSGASVVPVGDLLASAANLIAGEADEGIAAVVVRGLQLRGEPSPATELVRSPELDMFAVPDRDYTA